MTRQSEPLTWKYKLPLIITVARHALGALTGAPSWEQSCPLTPLHFSWFKGFSPCPSQRFPCLGYLQPLPGPSRSLQASPAYLGLPRMVPVMLPSAQPLPGRAQGRGGEARPLKYHLPPSWVYSQSSDTLLIFFVFSQSIFKMGVKDTLRRHV